MRSDYVDRESLGHALALLMPENGLVIRLCLETGLRIGDALEIKAAKLSQRMTITEKKTGKKRRIYISMKLLEDLKENSRGEWVFPGRKPGQHRTRQAVWADLKRASKACRIRQNLTPHSARKIYAVSLLEKGVTLDEIQKRLNHESAGVTAIYALADKLAAPARRKKRRR